MFFSTHYICPTFARLIFLLCTTEIICNRIQLDDISLGDFHSIYQILKDRFDEQNVLITALEVSNVKTKSLKTKSNINFKAKKNLNIFYSLRKLIYKISRPFSFKSSKTLSNKKIDNELNGNRKLSFHYKSNYCFGIVGLNNMGNTCYFSSALQCLLRTPFFTSYFLSNQYKKDINKLMNNFGKLGNLTEEFAKLVESMYSVEEKCFSDSDKIDSKIVEKFQNQRPQYFENTDLLQFDCFSPSTFLKAFKHYKPYFDGNDQHDSQEFLSELLDSIHEDLKLSSVSFSQYYQQYKNKKKLVEFNSDQSGLLNLNSTTYHINMSDSVKKNEVKSVVDIMKLGMEYWDKYNLKNESIVSSIFQGQLCSKISCKQCNFSSVRFEPFTTLSLSIPKHYLDINENSSQLQLTVIIYRKMPRLSQIKKMREIYGKNSFPLEFLFNVYK
jgi:ubiquitin C-terminal hydrolase